ncbi:GNAT family N-acetyltransferase [Tissierella carlieri]|uniref:GNAT family N-acetyltransferase n=1 Tax=Tissierella carlieri TaxID=689904 RepID=UPI001FEB40BB|nr:GNAT family N-acetyltransferase [Tissierella carlieri]
MRTSSFLGGICFLAKTLYHTEVGVLNFHLSLQNAFYTREEMNEKKSNVFIMFIDKEMVGSVEIHENIIDHLFVNPKYQNKGYGKKLLFFAINRLQEAGTDEITLFVADLNKEAVQLYLNNGFKCINTTIENWR